MTSFPKQNEALSERYLRFAEFEVDLDEEALRRGGQKLNINRRMFQVLCLLIERRGEIVSKGEFFEKVWGGSFVEDNNLTVTITALRKVLNDDAKHARFIENLPRKGYRFTAKLDSDDRPPNSLEPTRGDDDAPGYETRFLSGWLPARFPVLLSIGVIVILGFLGVGFSGLWLTPDPAAYRRESIAILPFENLTSGSEYLADGLTDGIINDLLRQSGLRVIDRNSAYQYRERIADPTSAGRELNVQTVLTGRVEQRGEVLIINAELTDLATNTKLWSQQFRRRPVDLFATQREISQAIVQILHPELTANEKSRFAKRLTDDPEAYDLYLKGRYLWNKRTDIDYRRAIDLFKAAIDRDPTFAKAYVGLADAYTLVSPSKELGVTLEEKNELTRAAVQKALEIDPDLGEAYASLAINKCYYDWDWAGAERDYQRALELNPNDATAHHWYAEFLAMQGRFEESRREYEIASSLDPLSMPIKLDRALSYYYARDYDTALALLSKEKEAQPEYQRTYGFLVYVYREKGMLDAAVLAIEKISELRVQRGEEPPEYLKTARVYVEQLRSGAKSDDTQDFWRAELEYGPRDPLFKVAAYSKLGDADNAITNLEKCYHERCSGMVWLKVAPEYDGVRSDPRFADLLRRVGF
jgi:TolB-like protein/DNA-binding winged helix-turn-helix (wHTH) protein/Tfp pilus assembly protein PilF